MHLKRLVFIAGAILVLTGLPTFSAAQSSRDTKWSPETLSIITDFVNKNCPTPPMNGSQGGIGAKVEVKFSIPELLKKLVDIGVTVKAEANDSKYDSVLQKDLADTLKNSMECRERLNTLVFDRLLPRTPVAYARPVFAGSAQRRPSGGPTAGCSCGARDITFRSPENVKVDQEFQFVYDANPICRGQGFDNFYGTIAWGEAWTQMANNNDNGQYPGIFGVLNVKFKQKGDYHVVANLNLDCLDNHCRNTCSAHGTTLVHVD